METGQLHKDESAVTGACLDGEAKRFEELHGLGMKACSGTE